MTALLDLPCYQMLRDDCVTGNPLTYLVHSTSQGMYGRQNNGIEAAFVNESDALAYIKAVSGGHTHYEIFVTRKHYEWLAKHLPEHAKRFKDYIV